MFEVGIVHQIKSVTKQSKEEKLYEVTSVSKPKSRVIP
jgi:hypothetical protein